MDTRKTLKDEYKQRNIIGGIFKITNIRNGMYFLDYTPDLQAKQNSFDFMVSSGSLFHYSLKRDWDTFGSQAFNFEIVESLEKKKDQSQDQFIDDLKMLEQLWSEKLNAALRY
jgi:hypothetical protein